MNSLNLYPSILDAKPNRLIDLLNTFKNHNITGIHIDVMDGNYVPSYGFNDRFISWIRKNTDFYQDVHLMINNPDDAIDIFINAGANGITVHYNSSKDLYYLISHINDGKVNSGVALNPAEKPEVLTEILPIVHHVLIMTCSPGRPSKGSIIEMTKKIIWLQQYRSNHHLNFRIQVDGGITSENANQFLQAGCDDFVSGGFITKTTEIDKHIEKLQDILK